jgi:DNA mismatch repair protein MutL
MPIRQLPEALVNRIAAGEVVERPASVVKELVENALDAGARRIEVVLAGGGARLIRVTDDGSGMEPADLALAVERHATSKLAGDDLDSISTLGFRGEALPSIGSIARLSIVTRTRGADEASEILVDGGNKSEVKPAALGEGTRIEVRDLFYATPARLKFLKSERAETAAAVEAIRRLALARPDVAFTFVAEDRAPVTYAARGTDHEGRLSRMADVLGAELRENAVAVEG